MLKQPLSPEEMQVLIALAQSQQKPERPAGQKPSQSSEYLADGSMTRDTVGQPQPMKNPMQGTTGGMLAPFMNQQPAPANPMMMGMGQIGYGPMAAMQRAVGTPEGLESIGQMKMTEKPKPGINSEAGWLMILASALGSAGGASPQAIQNFLGGITNGVQNRMQSEANIREQQAKFAFNRANQMRDNQTKDAANQSKGAGLLLDASQAKTPTEAKILIDEAARVLKRKPSASEVLGIMDNATQRQKEAEDIAAFNRSVKEEQMAAAKTRAEETALKNRQIEFGKGWTRWTTQFRDLAEPPKDLTKFRNDYNSFVAKNDELGGNPLPSFESLVAEQTDQRRARKAEAQVRTANEHWETTRQDRLKREAAIDKRRAEADKAKAEGKGADDPRAKGYMSVVVGELQHAVSEVKKLGDITDWASPAEYATYKLQYSATAMKLYTDAATKYGYDHKEVKRMRGILEGGGIPVPNMDPGSVNLSPKADAPANGAFQGPYAPVGPDNGVKPRRRVVGVGNAQVSLGVPYKWGGTDPEKGVDCSSLTQCIYRDNGIQIPRTAIAQWNSPRMKPATLADMKPGDLVFFETSATKTKDRYSKSAGGYVTHVAVVGNDGKLVQAVSKGTTSESLQAYIKRSGSKLLGIKRYSA